MTIYTHTGGNGKTSLATGERVPKCDDRVEAYGMLDELSAFIGVLKDSFCGIDISDIFLATGWLEFSPSLLFVFFPFRNIHSNSFASAFMVWWLFTQRVILQKILCPKNL